MVSIPPVSFTTMVCIPVLLTKMVCVPVLFVSYVITDCQDQGRSVNAERLR